MKKVAFVGTGGTLSSLGSDSLDIIDYSRHGKRLEADAIAAAVPELSAVAEVVPVRFRAIPSPEMSPPAWHELAVLCGRLAVEHCDLAGIVVGHPGAIVPRAATASLAPVR